MLVDSESVSGSLCFFFSSRRRHTRCSRDWSSDVCSSDLVTFTLRLMESFEETRQVFSPLLVRFLSGVDHTTRPVKISDSGRIRNELQTMIPQALEHDGDRIRVRFERINEMVLPRDKQARIREVLQWYKANHPIWFEWLEPV